MVGLVAATAGVLALVAAVHLARVGLGRRLRRRPAHVPGLVRERERRRPSSSASGAPSRWRPHRPLAVPLRALALGDGGRAVLAAWLTTQSKGAGIALARPAVVVLALSPARLRLLVARRSSRRSSSRRRTGR